LISLILLDAANDPQLLSQTASDLSVDFAAFAKQRSQFLKGQRHYTSKCGKRQQRYGSEPPIQIEEDNQRDRRGYQTADELNQASADQISYTLGIGHDPGDEHS